MSKTAQHDSHTRTRTKRLRTLVASASQIALLFIVIAPRLAWACACGCGIFDVGTSSLFPSESGGLVYFEYDFSDQYSNWVDAHSSRLANNDDKVIRSSFFTVGGQYMFNRSWGVMLQIPYTDRYFKTTEDDGSIQSFQHSALGDIRLEAMYTGFSEDMSTGIRFGVKFASGDFTYPNFDRDTEIGSGSTDVLLGVYHIGNLPITYKDRPFNWYAQTLLDQPFWTQQQYQPGTEVDSAVGALYNFGEVLAPLKEIAPVLSLINGWRNSDHGANANPNNSGYARLYIAPGFETMISVIRIYADVEIPVYQWVEGNQLVAPVLLKTIISYDF